MGFQTIVLNDIDRFHSIDTGAETFKFQGSMFVLADCYPGHAAGANYFLAWYDIQLS